MIVVTTHAVDHFAGRCRRPLPEVAPGDRWGRRHYRHVEAVVESGRMGTRLEARCLSLWVARARRWDSMHAGRLAPADVIVADDCGVGFVLGYHAGKVTVTTAVLMHDVFRFARGLPGSKLKQRLAAEGLA